MQRFVRVTILCGVAALGEGLSEWRSGVALAAGSARRALPLGRNRSLCRNPR